MKFLSLLFDRKVASRIMPRTGFPAKPVCKVDFRKMNIKETQNGHHFPRKIKASFK